MIESNAANERALWAAESKENLNQFLTEEKLHILKLTGRILHKEITESEDESSIALLAVSEAVEKYDRTRGDFWSYAAYVIKSRIYDYYRSEQKTEEISVSPSVFAGEFGEDGAENAQVKEIGEKTAYTVNTDLRDEIEAVEKELADYGIDFFDLAGCSPKSAKTKGMCALVLKAIFTPPPLLAELRKNKALPIKKILARQKVSAKLIDRHRKYLMGAALILGGDYPLMAEYLPYQTDAKEGCL